MCFTAVTSLTLLCCVYVCVRCMGGSCNSLIHHDNKKQTLQIDVRTALCLPSRHLRNLK